MGAAKLGEDKRKHLVIVRVFRWGYVKLFAGESQITESNKICHFWELFLKRIELTKDN
jgi:hypothetical protein